MLFHVTIKKISYSGKCSLHCLAAGAATALGILFLACACLMIYAGIMIHQVDSQHNVSLSTTENFSLSHLVHNQLHWYARDICIKNLTQGQQDQLVDDQVTVSLVTKSCKDVHDLKNQTRVISKSFTSDHNALLDFYWFSKTKVSFEVNITSRSEAFDTTGGYLGVYIIHTEEQLMQCTRDKAPENAETLIFNFNGSSTNNVNCTLIKNSTSVCSSSVVDISITRRYYVCMLLSSRLQGTDKLYVNYSLSAEEFTYNLTGTERKVCQLNITDCCVSFGSIFKEPTCVFIQTTALGSDNQAKELLFCFSIFVHKNWETLIYSGVLGILLLAPTLLYVCGRVVYWMKYQHPNVV